LNGNSRITNVTGNEGYIIVDKADRKLAIGKKSNDDLTIIYPGAVNDEMAGNAENLINKSIAVESGNSIEIVLEEGQTQDGASFTLDDKGDVIPDSDGPTPFNGNLRNVYAAASANYIQLLATQNNLAKRLGEIRDAEGETGIWARMYNGKREYAGSNIDVENQTSTVQVGVDYKLENNLFVGAAVSKSDGNSNYFDGSGQNKTTSAAIYGTLLLDDAQYIDLIGHYGWNNNKLDSRTNTGETRHAEYDNKSFNVSVEYGNRIQLRADGFYLEPQIELSYGHLDAANYLNNTTVVTQKALNSFIARAGFNIGQKMEKANLYLRLNAVHQFDGKADITIGERTEKVDFSGTSFEVGIGGSYKISKNAHFYADVEKSFGGAVKTTWQWNAGVRFEF
jgi:outer membrane autotransporter protein